MGDIDIISKLYYNFPKGENMTTKEKQELKSLMQIWIDGEDLESFRKYETDKITPLMKSKHKTLYRLINYKDPYCDLDVGDKITTKLISTTFSERALSLLINNLALDEESATIMIFNDVKGLNIASFAQDYKKECEVLIAGQYEVIKVDYDDVFDSGSFNKIIYLKQVGDKYEVPSTCDMDDWEWEQYKEEFDPSWIYDDLD